MQLGTSWLYLIGDVKEWIQPVLMIGATVFITSFFAQLGKEFAKKLTRKRTEKIPGNENPHVQQLDTIIKSIGDTQKALEVGTRVSIGVPIPGKLSRGNITLELSYDTDERLAFEISTFILSIEAIHDAVKTEVLGGSNPVFGVGIRIIEETRIEITWKEYPVFKERIITLDTYAGARCL